MRPEPFIDVEITSEGKVKLLDCNIPIMEGSFDELVEYLNKPSTVVRIALRKIKEKE